MVDDGYRLVLSLLQEIRTKQIEQAAKSEATDARLAGIEQRLGHIETHVADMRFQVTYGLDVANLNQIKGREVDARLSDMDDRLKLAEGLGATWPRGGTASTKAMT